MLIEPRRRRCNNIRGAKKLQQQILFFVIHKMLNSNLLLSPVAPSVYAPSPGSLWAGRHQIKGSPIIIMTKVATVRKLLAVKKKKRTHPRNIVLFHFFLSLPFTSAGQYLLRTYLRVHVHPQKQISYD